MNINTPVASMKRPFCAIDKFRNFSSGLPWQTLAPFTRVSTCSILASDSRVEGSCSMRGHTIAQSCWPWHDKCHWKSCWTCRLKLAVNVGCFVEAYKTPTLQKQLPVWWHLSSLWAIIQSEHIHNSIHDRHSTYFLTFITCWGWSKWGHPSLKAFKRTSSYSFENLYRYGHPKRKKMSRDRHSINRNHTEWYPHNEKSPSFSLLILPHIQFELSLSHLQEENEGLNLS